VFEPELNGSELRLRYHAGRNEVFDPIRKRWVALTPEEHVRQLLIRHLLNDLNYPGSLIAVEKTIKFGTLNKRFDVLVFDKSMKPAMLIECKAPEIDINEKTLYQLLNYQSVLQCRYWVLINGRSCFCAEVSDVNNIKWLGSIPLYSEQF